MKLKVAIALALILAFASAHAQELWKGSTYGMTVSQVSALFPTALPPSHPSTLHGGAIERLELGDIKIANRDFVAHLYFKSEALSQVTLSLSDSVTPYEGKLVYDSLLDALRAKYGKEMSRHNKSDGFMATDDTTWMNNGANISLDYLAVGNSQPIVNINYQVRISASSNNL